jgi:hypothetical protein
VRIEFIVARAIGSLLRSRSNEIGMRSVNGDIVLLTQFSGHGYYYNSSGRLYIEKGMNGNLEKVLACITRAALHLAQYVVNMEMCKSQFVCYYHAKYVPWIWEWM